MNEVVSVDWLGDRAVQVDCGELNDRMAVARRLAQAFPGLAVRSGLTTVLVESRTPTDSLLADVMAALATGPAGGPGDSVPRQVIEIPVTYCGPDLVDVAHALGLTLAELVDAHCRQVWSVAMMGFAPGFAYLVPVGEELAPWGVLHRRPDPRPDVPQGSVAIAAGMSAVYPARSPGGWHLIGRTESAMFDPDGRPPALLAPDDIVRFRESAP